MLERTERRNPAHARFEDLWSDTAPAVHAWTALHVREALRPQLDPEDVLQEVAYRAFDSFERFDVNEGPFRAWVFGIARNVLYGALQRVGRAESRGGLDTGSWARMPDTTTSITRRVARSEEISTFVSEVRRLDEDDRRLLLRRGLEGQAHEEIARELGISTDAAIKRWTRLLERLSSVRSLVAIAE